MAASRKRIMFTPGEDTLIAVERLAELQERPVSAVVSEMMDTITPFMLDLVDAVAAAKKAEAQAKASIVAAADEAAESMRPHVAEVQEAFWKLLRTVEAGGAPPSSNTGVTLGDLPRKRGH